MSKKRFIWQRRLSAGLSVLLCLSMLPVAALAEEPDGSEDALRNTAVEKVDTEIIENTTDNDAVVEDAIVENAVIENDAVESSDDADADAQDIDVQDIDADAVNVQAAAADTLIRFVAAGTPAQTRIMPATRLSRTGSRSAVRVSCGIHKRTDTTI